MKANSKLKETIDYLVEINTLKKTPRQGWRVVGPPVEKDMVAAHVMEVAQIAYILGKMEKVDAQKCVTMAVFHDNSETRLGERDKISTRYFEPKNSQVDLKAAEDQINSLPKEIGKEIYDLIYEANYGKSLESKIVRDADNLEVALQAKIFDEGGSRIPKNLLSKYVDPERVESKSAKELMILLRQKRELLTRWFKSLGLS